MQTGYSDEQYSLALLAQAKEFRRSTKDLGAVWVGLFHYI